MESLLKFIHNFQTTFKSIALNSIDVPHEEKGERGGRKGEDGG